MKRLTDVYPGPGKKTSMDQKQKEMSENDDSSYIDPSSMVFMREPSPSARQPLWKRAVDKPRT